MASHRVTERSAKLDSQSSEMKEFICQQKELYNEMAMQDSIGIS